MSWQIFDKISTLGFQSTKVESAATLITTSGKQQWQRLFCGNSEGSIHLYECVQEATKGTATCSLKFDQVVREAPKDKKGPASCFKIHKVRCTMLFYILYSKTLMSPIDFVVMESIFVYFRRYGYRI
jgi:hypothetical protein